MYLTRAKVNTKENLRERITNAPETCCWTFQWRQHACAGTHVCTHTNTYTHRCMHVYRLGRVSMGYQQQLNDPWCGEKPITSIYKILRLNSRLYPIHIQVSKEHSFGQRRDFVIPENNNAIKVPSSFYMVLHLVIRSKLSLSLRQPINSIKTH